MIKEQRKIVYEGKTLSLATKHSETTDTWLVFLHGIGCAKECFDEVFSTELTKDYSVLTFDFVGFGGSDKPSDFAYTMEQHADIADKLIAQYEPAKIVLIGHSMGGTIGTILATHLANLVSFINLEGNFVSEDAGIVSRRTTEQTEVEFIKVGYDSFLARLKESEASAHRTWADWYANSSKIAIYRSGTSLVKWSDSGKLVTLFNTLRRKAFVYGDKTAITFGAREFQDVKVVTIPNSGHFMMLDNPSKFYSAIRKYLSELKV